MSVKGMVKAKGRPVKCDCLNVCGDDPWLKDGRSQPCERLQNERAAAAQAREDAYLLRLSADTVAAWLDAGCKPQDTPDMHITDLVNYARTATDKA